MNRFAGLFIYWYSIQNIPSVSVVVGLSNTMTFSDTLFNWCENQSVKRTGSLGALWKWPISSNFNIKQTGHLKAKSELSIFILIMIISKNAIYTWDKHISRGIVPLVEECLSDTAQFSAERTLTENLNFGIRNTSGLDQQTQWCIYFAYLIVDFWQKAWVNVTCNCLKLPVGYI